MTVSGTDLAMTRGDTELIIVTCTAAPFSAGDTVTLTLRADDVYGAIALQKTITEFEEDGSAYIPILPGDTASLEMDGDYVYDVQVIRADGTVTTIIKPSKFEIEEEVTY